MHEKLTRPWLLLKEPRFVSAMLAIAYTAGAFAGLILIADTPGDLVDKNGIALAFLVGGLFSVGGLLGVISLHGGDWWMERACIYFICAAMLGYMIALWFFDASLSERLIRTLLSIAFVALLAARFYKIRGMTLDPTK
jgi:hypothetical protein